MERLFVSIGLLILVGSLVCGEVPSYIQVCGRRNPHLDQCIRDSVHALMPRLKQGIPELDVPPIEPLEIEEITLAQLDNFKAVATRCKLFGLSNFDIKVFRADFVKQTFQMRINFAKIVLDSDYDVKAKILVPINEKGPIKTIVDNVVADIVMKFELVERRGRKLVYFPSMTTKLVIPDYEAVFRPHAEGATENPMTQAINQVLVSSRKEIIESMTPNIEQAVSKKVLEVSNKIVKHFTFDELFPDRE